MPTGKRSRNLYGDLIVESTGCAPYQAAAVEEMMRMEHPTLDALTRPRFKSCAKNAIEVCRALGTHRESQPMIVVSPTGRLLAGNG